MTCPTIRLLATDLPRLQCAVTYGDEGAILSTANVIRAGANAGAGGIVHQQEFRPPYEEQRRVSA